MKNRILALLVAIAMLLALAPAALADEVTGTGVPFVEQGYPVATINATAGTVIYEAAADVYAGTYYDLTVRGDHTITGRDVTVTGNNIFTGKLCFYSSIIYIALIRLFYRLCIVAYKLTTNIYPISCDTNHWMAL